MHAVHRCEDYDVAVEVGGMLETTVHYGTKTLWLENIIFESRCVNAIVLTPGDDCWREL